MLNYGVKAEINNIIVIIISHMINLDTSFFFNFKFSTRIITRNQNSFIRRYLVT